MVSPLQRKALYGVWSVAIVADALSTLVAVLLGVGEEGNPIPAAVVGAFAWMGTVGAHIVLVLLGSLVCAVLVYTSVRARGRYAPLWRIGVLGAGFVKCGVAVLNVLIITGVSRGIF